MLKGKRISVFEDGWYFENMRIAAKRYYWGVFFMAVSYILINNYCKNKELFNQLIYLPVFWLMVNALIVLSALNQVKADTEYIKEECLSDVELYAAFSNVCNKILRNWIIFSIVNGLVLAYILGLYTFDVDIFYMSSGISFACVALVNWVFLMRLYKKRKAVFHTNFRPNVDLDLKDGEEKRFDGGFDLNLNGQDIVIVHSSADRFFVFRSNQIKRLQIKNLSNKVAYQYKHGVWRKAEYIK